MCTVVTCVVESRVAGQFSRLLSGPDFGFGLFPSCSYTGKRRKIGIGQGDCDQPWK